MHTNVIIKATVKQLWTTTVAAAASTANAPRERTMDNYYMIRVHHEIRLFVDITKQVQIVTPLASYK